MKEQDNNTVRDTHKKDYEDPMIELICFDREGVIYTSVLLSDG